MFTRKFSFWNIRAVKATSSQKYKSADLANQSEWLIPYRNELAPPLHDTCGTFGQVSLRNDRFDPIQLTTGMNAFRNDPYWGEMFKKVSCI